MIVRMTTLNIISNKVEELTKVFTQDILPVIKQQKGNVDCKLLEPVDGSGEYISMTVWDNKEDADTYHSGGVYKQLVDKVKNYFTKEAVLKTYKTEGVMENA